MSGPTELRTGVAHAEKIGLSQLIDILNEGFGTDFKPADQLFFDSIREDAVTDSNLRQAAPGNSMENSGYLFLKAFEGLFIDRMEQNEDITAKCLNETEFQKVVSQELLEEACQCIHEQKHLRAQ